MLLQLVCKELLSYETCGFGTSERRLIASLTALFDYLLGQIAADLVQTDVILIGTLCLIAPLLILLFLVHNCLISALLSERRLEVENGTRVLSLFGKVCFDLAVRSLVKKKYSGS